MPRTAWMDNQLGIGEGLHHGAGTAGVIEMNMGRDHVSHLRRIELQFGQRHQCIGQRMVGAGFDEGRLAVVDNQVDRRHARSQVVGVETVDASAEILEWCRIFRPVSVPGDPHETYRRDGERNIGLRIFMALNAAPPAAPEEQQSGEQQEEEGKA